jgi:hypothetical protein
VNERGVALVAVTMVIMLAAVVCATLALTTSSEAQIAANFASSRQVFYAAEGAAEWAVAEVSDLADWPAVGRGEVPLGLADGPPAGSRTLSDGFSVNLDVVAAVNPDWHVAAHGRLGDLLPPSALPSSFYVVVLVSTNDEAEADGLNVLTEAFGPHGAHRVLELHLSRSEDGGVRIDSWSDKR